VSEFNCPHCKSENTQRLSVVFESGVSEINTRTNHMGVGIAGAVGLGGATSRTRGVQVSAIAARAAPPAKMRPILTFFVLSLASVIVGLFFGKASGLVALAGMIGAGYVAFTQFKYNGGQWKTLFAAWSRRFLCHKCGEQFEPDPRAA
jgi:hypothetical protein